MDRYREMRDMMDRYREMTDDELLAESIRVRADVLDQRRRIVESNERSAELRERIALLLGK